MDNDEIAQQYCESNRDNRFGIALKQARASERAKLTEVMIAQMNKEYKEKIQKEERAKLLNEFLDKTNVSGASGSFRQVITEEITKKERAKIIEWLKGIDNRVALHIVIDRMEKDNNITKRA